MAKQASEILEAMDSVRKLLEADENSNSNFGFELQEDERRVLHAMQGLLSELAIQLEARSLEGGSSLIRAAKAVGEYASNLDTAPGECTCRHPVPEHTVHGCWKDVNGREGSNICLCSRRTGYPTCQSRSVALKALDDSTT